MAIRCTRRKCSDFAHVYGVWYGYNRKVFTYIYLAVNKRRVSVLGVTGPEYVEMDGIGML